MGLEAEYKLKEGSKTLAGKIFLESSVIQLRGDRKQKIALSELKSVKAEGNSLILQLQDEVLTIEIGSGVEKWVEKILHPPSRLDKLGVKKGTDVWLHGDFPDAFEKELVNDAVRINKIQNSKMQSWKSPDQILLIAENKTDLNHIKAFSKTMLPKQFLWVVYPKGQSSGITQNDVMETARNSGLKDTKVMSFSTEHSALRFNLARKN